MENDAGVLIQELLMWMVPMLCLLFFLHTVDKYPDRIVLPEGIVSVRLQEDSRGFFLLDTRTKALYLLSHEGKILIKTDDEGEGPGSFIQPQSLAVYKDRVYVTDSRKQRVIVFDKQLEFISEKIMPGSCRQILVNESGVFVCIYSAKTHSMVTKFNLELDKELCHFGAPIEPEETLAGVQVSSIVFGVNCLYFMHRLAPKLFTYNLDGKQVAVTQIPGYPATVLEDVDLNDRNFHNSIEKMLALTRSGNELAVIEYSPDGYGDSKIYNYSPEQSKWEAPVQGKQSFLLGGDAYHLKELEEGMVLVKREGN